MEFDFTGLPVYEIRRKIRKSAWYTWREQLLWFCVRSLPEDLRLQFVGESDRSVYKCWRQLAARNGGKVAISEVHRTYERSFGPILKQSLNRSVKKLRTMGLIAQECNYMRSYEHPTAYAEALELVAQWSHEFPNHPLAKQSRLLIRSLRPADNIHRDPPDHWRD